MGPTEPNQHRHRTLGRRAVACPGWRWMAGMLCDDTTCMDVSAVEAYAEWLAKTSPGRATEDSERDLDASNQLVMLQVFISGPFSAPTPWETHKNVLRAEEAAAQVAHLGAMPQCPHTNSKNMVGIQDWQFWMDGCLEWLKRCDAVLFLPNWESSRGAKLEHAEAVLHDTPRFYNLASLKEWIENG